MNRCVGLTALLLAALSHAYPIEPQTLWELSGDAEVIVVATVERLHNGVRAPEAFAAVTDPGVRRFGEPLARLRVVTVLKGTPGAALDVVTEGRMMCPAPGRFVEGKTVLAFLRAWQGRWYVHGLSYGTLYPSPDELPIFKARIAEAIELQARKHTPAEKIQWAVRAASRRATRWHGTHLLSSGRDSRHWAERGPKEPVKLDDVQLSAIAEGFIAEPSVDRTTATIADLLKGYADPRIDRALVGAVDALLEDDDPYAGFQALKAVVERAGGDITLLNDIEPKASRQEIPALRRAWSTARKDLKLPAGIKLSPTRGMEGVGPETY